MLHKNIILKRTVHVIVDNLNILYFQQLCLIFACSFHCSVKCIEIHIYTRFFICKYVWRYFQSKLKDRLEYVCYVQSCILTTPKCLKFFSNYQIPFIFGFHTLSRFPSCLVFNIDISNWDKSNIGIRLCYCRRKYGFVKFLSPLSLFSTQFWVNY